MTIAQFFASRLWRLRCKPVHERDGYKSFVYIYDRSRRFPQAGIVCSNRMFIPEHRHKMSRIGSQTVDMVAYVADGVRRFLRPAPSLDYRLDVS